MAWLNDDGLYIKFGTEEGASDHRVGEANRVGGNAEVVLDIDLSLLTAATETIVNDVALIPANAQIVAMRMVTKEVGAGGTSFDMGLIQEDRTTAIDADGLLDAQLLASIGTLGETTEFTEASGTAGALVGTVLANAGLVTVTTTGTFTAGKVQFVIEYIPNAAID